jgi:hypothetical protein
MTCKVKWCDDGGERHLESIYVPPCVLPTSSASAILSAFEVLLPEFTSQLDVRCRSVKLAIVHETFDSAKPNIRHVRHTLGQSKPGVPPATFESMRRT